MFAIGALLALCGGSAMAGPVGSGLWHTEAQARARTSVVVHHADATCLGAVAATAAARPGVRKAKVEGGALRVNFHRAGDAYAAKRDVLSSVQAACPTGEGAQLKASLSVAR